MTDNQSNQERLITDLILNGKQGRTWGEIAYAHNIKSHGSPEQRRKAANDIWRKFNKLLQINNLDLTTVKQTLNGNGDILFETRRKLPEEKEISTEGMIVDKVTTNPHGGSWITYKNPQAEKEKEETISNTVQKLIDKHIGFLPNYEVNKKEYFDYLEEEPFTFDNKKKLAVVNLYDAHLDKLPIKSTWYFTTLSFKETRT